MSINDFGDITTKTYQKPTNLFLYISPHSSHPPGITTSLVFGLLRTYYRQNSKHDDFLLMTKLLFQRLIARGHQHDTLSVLFNNALTKIVAQDNDPITTKKPTTAKAVYKANQPPPVYQKVIEEEVKE